MQRTGNVSYRWNGAIIAAVMSTMVGCGSTVLRHQDAGPSGTGEGGAGGGAAVDAGVDTGAGGSVVVDARVDTGAGGSAMVDAGPDLPTCTGTCVLPFASSSDWAVYDQDPYNNPAAQRLGVAQPVCIGPATPPSCPAGAVVYGNRSGWNADLSTIPGALWVWGPGVSVTDLADLKTFVFVHTFTLGAAPTGTLKIAVDDAAEVRVNGSVAGATGSVTTVAAASAAATSLTTFDLAPLLVPGTNTIAIAAQNGPTSFAGCATPCTYASNPAGVVFGGTLSYH
jgi:hypothetical protein